MTEFIIVFLVSYLWHAMGITIGYHRLLSHRTFTCPKPVEYFWVLGGYLAVQGSPIWWATIHRAHHRHVDTPLDPHSPRNGWWNAQFGWMLNKSYPVHIDPKIQCPDLVRDPIYRFLDFGGNWDHAHQMTFAMAGAYRLLLWGLFGWPVALASLLAAVAVWQVPLMLNVICHIPKLGYKNYAAEDDSVNVWWVGWLALGEGWHNNHHAFPASARSGLLLHEIDVSWWTLCLMKKFGLIGRLNDVSAEALARKKNLAAAADIAQIKGNQVVSRPATVVLNKAAAALNSASVQTKDKAAAALISVAAQAKEKTTAALDKAAKSLETAVVAVDAAAICAKHNTDVAPAFVVVPDKTHILIMNQFGQLSKARVLSQELSKTLRSSSRR